MYVCLYKKNIITMSTIYVICTNFTVCLERRSYKQQQGRQIDAVEFSWDPPFAFQRESQWPIETRRKCHHGASSKSPFFLLAFLLHFYISFGLSLLKLTLYFVAIDLTFSMPVKAMRTIQLYINAKCAKKLSRYNSLFHIICKTDICNFFV